jgi:hypothetical protein
MFGIRNMREPRELSQPNQLDMVGERIWTSDPLVANYESTNSKCFIWCRLGSSAPFFLSLSCTVVVPKRVGLG